MKNLILAFCSLSLSLSLSIFSLLCCLKIAHSPPPRFLLEEKNPKFWMDKMTPSQCSSFQIRISIHFWWNLRSEISSSQGKKSVTFPLENPILRCNFVLDSIQISEFSMHTLSKFKFCRPFAWESDDNCGIFRYYCVLIRFFRLASWIVMKVIESALTDSCLIMALLVIRIGNWWRSYWSFFLVIWLLNIFLLLLESDE